MLTRILYLAATKAIMSKVSMVIVFESSAPDLIMVRKGINRTYS
jgi:hypothetical protein